MKNKGVNGINKQTVRNITKSIDQRKNIWIKRNNGITKETMRNEKCRKWWKKQ